jgi:release factor glutamine methyltransferase
MLAVSRVRSAGACGCLSRVPVDLSDPERDRVVGRLRAAGCVFAEEEAALLLAEAPASEALEEMVARRVTGQPLEQVVGWAQFRGARMHVGQGVFVPRLRTELLVELAVPLLVAGRTVLDLCCGTGAVGAALAREVPGIEVYAADLDPAAVACARRNLPAARVFEGDLYTALPGALRGRVDVLAVNAPYVPTDEIALMPAEARDHEHLVALDGGADGLDVQRRVVACAREWLAPGGHLLIETSVRQAPVTLALFVAAGLEARVEHSEEYDATVVVGAA